MNDFLLDVLLTIIIIVIYVFCHEVTHYEINMLYNCKINDLHFNYVLSGDCDGDNRVAHSINEIVGYNVMPALLILIILVLKR